MPEYPFECFGRGTEVEFECKGVISEVNKRWKMESTGWIKTNECGEKLLLVKNTRRPGSGWIRFHQITYESYHMASERLQQVGLSLSNDFEDVDDDESEDGKDKHANYILLPRRETHSFYAEHKCFNIVAKPITNSSHFHIQVSQSDTIFRLKEKICIEYQASPEALRLWYCGGELNNACTVAEYDIGEDDCVNISMALTAAGKDGA